MPHKPLLLYVLSQYKAGHPRLFNHVFEIHEKLYPSTSASP
ncbi:hypothetical protein AD16_2373 [Escherichia coli 3-267-03_S4_C2]|nr:hypothetical protein AD16_2373 [Escherichia coli 3-267-03_S4_C2]KEL85127.1 hypothetical protein AC22_2265 [Escherichia coli 5-366-08_S3_C2]